MVKQPTILGLYYITHIDNLASILKRGILSHAAMERERETLASTPIYNHAIVNKRRNRIVTASNTLWDFANLYFQPRNPMMYYCMLHQQANSIAVLHIRPEVLQHDGVFVSVGNAASEASEILPATPNGIRAIHKIWNDIQLEWWKEEDGTKRRIMAECLVPERVEPHLIQTIYVGTHELAEQLKSIAPTTIPVVPEPTIFFNPLRKVKLTGLLSLIEGDMFFSTMQTLTISVNCVGVMGKGLASRAKYQFPDVYVYYQDLCRKKTLKMGRPALYKREVSLDEHLVDEPSLLEKPNAETWFLLFPTKDHWRNRSDRAGIEQGLQWLRDTYRKQGIRSLALPALGCGLGGLEWSDIGPLMCRYMADFDIRTRIYLPREKAIPPEHLTREFLLAK